MTMFLFFMMGLSIGVHLLNLLTIPAIVIAPQVAAGKPWEPKKILEVLNYVQSNYKTDKNRVYVAGMSLGGYGTLDFAGEYPNS